MFMSITELPPPRRLCIRRILCDCVRARYLKESRERILMKFCRDVKRDPGRNRLDFAGDPDSYVDPRSFSMILCH